MCIGVLSVTMKALKQTNYYNCDNDGKYDFPEIHMYCSFLLVMLDPILWVSIRIKHRLCVFIVFHALFTHTV